MSSETRLFNAGNVTVTSKHFTVASRSYPMEAIRDAEVVYRSRTWAPVFTLFLTAVTFAISGLSLNRPVLEMAAVVALMLTATLFWKGGPRYSIALDTRDGYITALTSSERFFVESIGQVMQSTLHFSAQQAETRKLVFKAAQPPFRILPGKNLPARHDSVQSSMHPQVFAIAPRPTHRTSV